MFSNLNLFSSHIRMGVIEDCLPDQLRVDHGREFYLSLFVQELLLLFVLLPRALKTPRKSLGLPV